MSDVATERRARSGGGAARRAERTAVRIEAARYIERHIPNLEVLNEEALAIIEANAETVLQEIGVNFPEQPAALALWRDAGADVQGDRVRIPQGPRPRALRDRAPDLHPARPQPRTQRRDRRARTSSSPRSTARPSCAPRPKAAATRGWTTSACS